MQDNRRLAEREILEQKIVSNGGTELLPGFSAAPGIYLLQIEKGGRADTFKLIKE